MKNFVPTDPVETMLELQGVDATKADYQEAYDRLSEELGYDKPAFYCTVTPSDLVWLEDWKGTALEQTLARRWATLGSSQSAIEAFLSAISQLSTRVQKHLISSTTPDQALEKMSSTVLSEVDQSTTEILSILTREASTSRVQWHYPTFRWHGIDNQYHHWMSDFVSGDLGVSLTDARPVGVKIWSAIRWTLVLVIISLCLAILLSFPLAIYSTRHRESVADRWISRILFALHSIPKFWMATMLIVFFTTAEYGGWTDIFPSVGIWRTSGGGFLGTIASSWDMLILPLLVIIIPDVAYLSRVIRASLISENNKEYIQTARSKGMSETQIMNRHLIPNALMPTITLLAGVIPSALGSSLIVEVIFNIPGVGRLMYDSIRNADWAIVFPIVLIVSLVTVITFLLADLLIAKLNPKIKLGE